MAYNEIKIGVEIVIFVALKYFMLLKNGWHAKLLRLYFSVLITHIIDRNVETFIDSKITKAPPEMI